MNIAFPQLSIFDPGWSMRLLLRKIAKLFLPNVMRLYPGMPGHEQPMGVEKGAQRGYIILNA